MSMILGMMLLDLRIPETAKIVEWYEIRKVADAGKGVWLDSGQSVATATVQVTEKGWHLNQTGDEVLYAPGFTELGKRVNVKDAGKVKSNVKHKFDWGPFQKRGSYIPAFIEAQRAVGFIDPDSGGREHIVLSEKFIYIGIFPKTAVVDGECRTHFFVK